MTKYWIIYKAIEGSEPNQSFEMMAAPKVGEAVIPSEILSGVLGEKDIYVRRYGRRIGTNEIHLVTYTHHELNSREVKNLARQALKFAQERN